MARISENTSDMAPRPSRSAVVAFVVLIIVSIGIGYGIYSRQMNQHELQVNEAIFRSAQVRAAGISTILHERIGDAKIASSTPLLREALSSWLNDGGKENDEKRKLSGHLHTLKNVYDYVQVAVMARGGKVLLTADGPVPSIDEDAARTVEDTFNSGMIRMSPIRLSSDFGKPLHIIDVGAPISAMYGAGKRVTAVLLLRFSAEEHIYPSLQFSPFPSLPNDALLAGIENGKVIALSESRFSPYRFLNVLPIGPGELQESAGSPTRFSFVWRQKNGDKEIAAAYRIDATSWFVITMVPKSASDAIVRNTVLVAMLVSAVMLFTLGLGVVYWWKYRESDLKFIAAQTENQRRLMQQQYEYLSQYANDMIMLADADYRILSANERTVQVFGYPVSSLIGNPISMLSPQAEWGRLNASLDRLRHEGAAIFEIFQKRCDDSIFPVEISARTIDFEGKLYSQFICRDITERKEAELKIHSLAYYDSVTKLPNRILLNDRLNQGMHLAARSGKKMGILFMDLDNFKNINDSLGHQIGDELLYSVGQRLLSCIREGDTVARIGGDEFLVMLANLDAGEEAHHVAKKIIASFVKPFLLKSHEIFISTSIGISLFPDDAKASEDLIRYADSALYEAKARGRNNYQFFTEELNEQITRASKIENYLRQAIESGELCLWYQPQIDARSGRVIGAEALLRPREESLDRFSPAAFIAIAEERGLITKLGEWTLREVCRQCRLWKMQGLRTVPIAVNVSAIQLRQREFSDSVFQILAESGVDASSIELEITETAIMGRAQDVADLATRFRESGIRMSIDDFGTGYSNLSYLKHIPIDKIKIDRTFILDMLSDPEDETIIQAIIRMAQGLHLRVIAEGVERKAQMERLLSFGCHEAQGFLYSQAVSPETFKTFLKKENCFNGMAETTVH